MKNKNPNPERDVEPLGLFDILRSVRDAMNLRNLRWLLYDEKRRTQWFADLERQHVEEFAQPPADSELESAKPELDSPSQMDPGINLPPTKCPPRAASDKRADTSIGIP